MSAIVIGLISDTHGLLRPEALEGLAGSARIIHAGDVGDPGILDRLTAIAPVTVVRGNIDVGPHARDWPLEARLTVGGVTVHVIHDLSMRTAGRARAEDRVVVFGHSHKPVLRHENQVLFVNPGSAGPRRFRLPIGVGRLTIANGVVEADLIPLAV